MSKYSQSALRLEIVRFRLENIIVTRRRRIIFLFRFRLLPAAAAERSAGSIPSRRATLSLVGIAGVEGSGSWRRSLPTDIIVR